MRQTIADGRDPAEAAAEAGARVVPITGVKRDDQGYGAGLSPAVVERLFATEPRKTAEMPAPLPGGSAVVLTDAVHAADPAQDAAGMQAVRDEVEEGLRADVLAQFENQLRRRYPVEIDQAELASLLDAEGGAF